MESIMNWQFGRYIEKILAEKEWSLSKLAKKTGMSHSYVSSIIHGGSARDKNPPKISVDTLLQLAKALQISEIDLLFAYKGIDFPEKSRTQKGFDLNQELVIATIRHGKEFQNLSPTEQEKLVETVERLTRKFIDLTVENELGRLPS